MREGGLDAPMRHTIDWNDPGFNDALALDKEMRRQLDVCHGCRRCFNLCDSFPRLFDLIDQSESGELDGVKSEDFRPVVDACTLCDMCFMTKCPYVPPHAFNLDIPHLFLRYRAVDKQAGRVPMVPRQLSETDRNGRLFGMVAPLANWGTDVGNPITRPIMEAALGVDRAAAIPKFHGKTFTARTRTDPPVVNRDAPAFGRKAVIYATCFVNYNNPEIGVAARNVLARNGVETEVVYPGCCGMPKLEHGDLPKVAEYARRVAGELSAWIDKGYNVIALVPSCALMLKFEWPLIVPGVEAIQRLSKATWDISEYVVGIARKEGLAPGLTPIQGGITVHLACHARAQNVGPKAAELLRLIPDANVSVIERCSGHGGSWGMMKENFASALKVGRPVARQARDAGNATVVSECPLAAMHIRQGIEKLAERQGTPPETPHPIEVFARAYGF
jgi:glycerol-3-phosphate dehydrogenase subunit C